MASPTPRLIIHLLQAPRHPALLIGLCAASVCAAVYFPIMNTDIWWHLAAGRWMVQAGGVPRVDPFAVGTALPWVDVHWLFQLLSYGVFKLGGLGGLVLIKALLCAVSAGVLVLAARGARGGGGAALAPLTVAVTLYLARHLILARPIVVTLLCMSLTLLILELYCRGRRARVLWWLAPVQLLWSSCQGLFLLGPGLVGIYFLGEGAAQLLRGSQRARGAVDPEVVGVRTRGLAVAALGLVLCSVLTPYGLDSLLLPFKLLSRIEPGAGELFRLNVTENIPPWLLVRQGRSVGPLMWVALVTCVSFLLPGRRLRLSHLLATIVFLALALIANRNVLLFFWLAGFVLAVNLDPLLRRLGLLSAGAVKTPLASVGAAKMPLASVGAAKTPLAPRWIAAATLAVLALLGVQRYVEARAEPPAGELAPFRVPSAAVAHLKGRCALPPGSAIFNSVRYGGYLIWELFPQAKATIDGRLVIRSAEQFAAHLALADGEGDFTSFARAHQIKAALLPAAYPDRYLPLVRGLYLDSRWTLVFTDGTQALFIAADQALPGCRGVDLSSGPTVHALAAALGRSWTEQPLIKARALLHLARLLAEVGELGLAQELLEGQSGEAAGSLLARVLYLDGDAERAEKMAREHLERDPAAVESLALLARIAADRGEISAALDLLQRALEVDPYHPQARRLMARLEQEQLRSRR